MLQPSLLQDDTIEQKQQHNLAIAQQREEYQYSDTNGIVLIKELPQSEMFSLKYMSGIISEGVTSTLQVEKDRKSTRLNSSHRNTSRMPSSA